MPAYRRRPPPGTWNGAWLWGAEVLRHSRRKGDVGRHKWWWQCVAAVLQEQGVTMPHLESHTYLSRWGSFWGSHPLRLAPDTDGCGIPKASLVPQTCADRVPTGTTRQGTFGDLFCFLLDRHKWSCSQQSLWGHIRQDKEREVFIELWVSAERRSGLHTRTMNSFLLGCFSLAIFEKIPLFVSRKPFLCNTLKVLLVCFLWA